MGPTGRPWGYLASGKIYILQCCSILCKCPVQLNLPTWSPLLSSHLYYKRSPFSCPVIENFIWIEPVLRDLLSYEAYFSLSQRWPINTGLTVIFYLWLYMQILLLQPFSRHILLVWKSLVHFPAKMKFSGCLISLTIAQLIIQFQFL